MLPADFEGSPVSNRCREFTNTTTPRSSAGNTRTSLENPPTPPFLVMIRPTPPSGGVISQARPVKARHGSWSGTLHGGLLRDAEAEGQPEAQQEVVPHDVAQGRLGEHQHIARAGAECARSGPDGNGFLDRLAGPHDDGDRLHVTLSAVEDPHEIHGAVGDARRCQHGVAGLRSAHPSGDGDRGRIVDGVARSSSQDADRHHAPVGDDGLGLGVPGPEKLISGGAT